MKKQQQTPLIEQYKSIQARYEPLIELNQAITKCIKLDWDLNFIPAKDQDKILKTQSRVESLVYKLQRQAETIFAQLKKNK